MRFTALVMSVATVVGLLGCASPLPDDTPGAISISIDYVEPPPDVSRSIGGYGIFAELWSPDGKRVAGGGEVPWNSTKIFENLPAGLYELEVRVVAQSDAVSCDDRGNCQRTFLGTTAECAATIEVANAATIPVVITTVGGNLCSIGSSQTD